ncbi:MAG: hypothetical protein KZQ79_20545 [Candidatus Thiodiazotropha sp. (ex Lucinoma borealis)]|nr:hypothetical protein [Candidatus Thiodiazotropha sp. (ex Lucinoma borealis)]
MKLIPDEPESQTGRREKQVMDNFNTEIELLDLRAQAHEVKYRNIDKDIVQEIEKRTTGNRMVFLKKL